MRWRFAALACLLALGATPAAFAVELEGTWYVLVHYQDSETGKPDQWRWDDRVWSFARKGDRLEWAEWPIVVLDDESGRFEAARGGRATRVLGKWEPSPAQLSDIRDGLQVNSRGSKTKTLRPEAGGTSFTSGEGAGADSALVITYSETWTIEGMPEAPVFARDDSMGSSATESMTGRTVYRTESVGTNAGEISGRFERDGTRTGRFKLMRAGGTEALKGAARNQQELQQKRFREAMTSSDEMRAFVRERVVTDLATRGVTLSDEEVDKLTTQAMEAARRSGSADDAGKALTEQAEQLFFSFAARGAKHDDGIRYTLPFDPAVPRKLGQGVGGDMGFDIYGNPVSSPADNPASHIGRNKYGFDWELPKGTPIVAARDGEVARVVDGFTGSGPAASTPANVVYVEHADGSYAEYVGLDVDIPVKAGDKVRAGQVIGACGGTGGWRGGLGGIGVHFAVAHLDEGGKPETVAILFDDGRKGFVPTPGSYYGGSGKATKAASPPGEAPAARQ